MQLNEIFLKDVARSIEGVVKADDAVNLATEVEEYVLTNDAAKGVGPLLAEYTNPSNANGVWISGFFGSGKSHLLKMLAHLLGDVAGDNFPRAKVSESFASKTDDAMLVASLRKAASIPAKSLLFNIDVKATLIAKDQTDALLKVFVKVFDESRGYFGNDGAVARFEEDLDKRGQYREFKEAFRRHAGIDWAQGREQTALEGHNIDKAFADVNGDANPGIIKQYQNTYAVSIEDFTNSVRAWLDQQEPNFRLNFFVDEVGQFIADDVKLMLNLQSIAESLATACRGRSWVFVTSQEDMEKVVGDRTKQQGNDFSKIQARFRCRVKLTSQDVEEVISKRLLEKNQIGTAELEALHAKEAANFATIFDFIDGAKTYRNFVGQAKFVATYPFVTYQIPMFQAAMTGLSDHNMFEGRNSSVGERSMLGVVQEVAKRIGGEQLGYLATFDQMFAGISAALKSSAQSAILQAERHLPDPSSEVTILANRLLKALFLVKYVDTFKASPRNLTVLVYDRFGLDLKALGTRVREALALLEQQSYVQRSGNVYEYLTNEEQEVEKEIKDVDIDAAEVSGRLFKYLSADILKTSKIRYAKTGQDFPFGYKLDDIPHSKQQELTVHFITPETSYTDEEIKMQGAGKDELRVVLGRDRRLLSDLRLLLKTEKYIKRRTSSGATPSMQAILQSKQITNTEREKEFIAQLRRTVGEAHMLINAAEVTSTSQDAVTRVTDGFQDLVSRTYTNLGLLGGATFSEQQVAGAVQNDPGLFGPDGLTVLTSPGTEMESWIISQAGRGEQVTVTKIADRFGAKPYGWSLAAIEVVLGYLVGAGKITMEIGSSPVARTEAAALIRNTAKHAATIVAPQKVYDVTKVAAFRSFCEAFFDEGAPPTDPAELARFGKDRLSAKRDEIAGVVAGSRYPFVDQLSPVVAMLDQVVGKQPDWYLTEFGGIDSVADELTEAKAGLIDPIRAFIKGQQAAIYDDARALLDANRGNLSFLPVGSADPVEALLADRNAFRGNKMTQLKAAADALRSALATALSEKRIAVRTTIEERRGELIGSEHYTRATDAAQRQVTVRIEQVLARIDAAPEIAVILQAGSSFESNEYPALFDLLAESPKDAPPPGDGGPRSKPEIKTVSIRSVQATGGPSILQSDADIDAYLAALRTALIETLHDGKRITL